MGRYYFACDLRDLGYSALRLCSVRWVCCGCLLRPSPGPSACGTGRHAYGVGAGLGVMSSGSMGLFYVARQRPCAVAGAEQWVWVLRSPGVVRARRGQGVVCVSVWGCAGMVPQPGVGAFRYWWDVACVK